MSTNHKFKAGKLRAAKKAVDTAVATAQSGGDNTAAISEKELDLHQLPDQVRDKFEKKANRAIVDIARTILADLQSSEAAKSRSRKKQGKKNDADAMPELDRFELSAYPYQETIGRAVYERIKLQLQSELLKVQRWVIENNLKMIVMFEGHDAAGKGGSIETKDFNVVTKTEEIQFAAPSASESSCSSRMASSAAPESRVGT